MDQRNTLIFLGHLYFQIKLVRAILALSMLHPSRDQRIRSTPSLNCTEFSFSTCNMTMLLFWTVYVDNFVYTSFIKKNYNIIYTSIWLTVPPHLLAQVCRVCGLLGYYNHKLKTGICSSCKNGDNISTMKLPYACKLLIQVGTFSFSLFSFLFDCLHLKVMLAYVFFCQLF